MSHEQLPSFGAYASAAYAPISEEVKDKLLKSAVPTLSAVMFQRGFHTRVFRGLRPINPRMVPFCGAAWTIRAIPVREDMHVAISSDEIPSRNRICFDAAPSGAVVVCGTGGNPHVALMGDIMSTALMVKGTAGVVLDTGVSDAHLLAEMPLAIVAAGSAPVSSFASIMVVDCDIPIGSCGVAVFPGDIIVGDSNGALCIPRHRAAEVADAAIAQERLEEFLMERIRAGAKINATYPPSAALMEEYRVWQIRKRDE